MLTLSRNTIIITAVTLLMTALSVLGADADVTVPPEARALMLAMPRPKYPYEARARHITGQGMYEILMDTKSGMVTRVVVVQSTGSKVLDEAAVNAFSRWRARPGKISRIRVPVNFTLAQSTR
jgi:TonB family protein